MIAYAMMNDGKMDADSVAFIIHRHLAPVLEDKRLLDSGTFVVETYGIPVLRTTFRGFDIRAAIRTAINERDDEHQFDAAIDAAREGGGDG